MTDDTDWKRQRLDNTEVSMETEAAAVVHDRRRPLPRFRAGDSIHGRRQQLLITSAEHTSNTDSCSTETHTFYNTRSDETEKWSERRGPLDNTTPQTDSFSRGGQDQKKLVMLQEGFQHSRNI